MTELLVEFSLSAYLTDTQLSRLTRIPDFAIRRPDPAGPGGPCQDKLHWVQVMLDGRVAAFCRRGVALPPPMVVADSWFSDSKLMCRTRMPTTAIWSYA